MIISLIVPIHNSEHYLKRCLNSLLLQSFFISHPNDFEILLIFNNSTDCSLEIAQQYMKKHPQIHIFTHNSPGAAAARNFGVKKASGKYIWFIDSDDYIARTAIAKLYKSAERNHSDLTTFAAQKIVNNQIIRTLPALNSKSQDFKSRFVRYGFGPWHFLIHRNWWLQNHFQFPEGHIHEDMALMSALILFTDHISSVNEPLYFYCENPNSVLHQSNWNSNCFDIFPALDNLYQIFKSQKAINQYYSELEYFFIWNLLLDSAKDFSRDTRGRSGFAQIRKLLKKYFPHWRNNKFFKQKSLLLRLRCRLAYYGVVF